MSNPKSEEYKEMKELEEYKQQVAFLQKQLNEKSIAINSLDNKLKISEKQIRDKDNQIHDLSRDLSLANGELGRIKKKLIYRLLIRN